EGTRRGPADGRSMCRPDEGAVNAEVWTSIKMNAHEGPIAVRETTTVWDAEAERLLADYERAPLTELLARANALGREGHGNVVSYSRKVFIPLTRLCRDVCGYCTFATTPRQTGSAYLGPDEVLAIARAGQAAGCHEALFTLGDKPEARYAAARAALARLGY